MNFKERRIKGVYEIDPPIFRDKRGFFLKSYNREAFEEFSLHRDWVQENHSGSLQKGIIRGFHFQISPYSEAKLVRCIRGKVLNVIVDLRKESKTFGQWDSIELSRENRKMIFIPEMFANAFCILEDNTELIYKSSSIYHPESERRIIWNDENLDVKWPVEEPIISSKDENNKSFEEFIKELKI